MSRMKHLLRKLHIGGGFNESHRMDEARPASAPGTETQQPPLPSPSVPSTSVSNSASAMARGRDGGDAAAAAESSAANFNFFEEEFQVQLALAISASDPGTGRGGGDVDSETAQIEAAQRISLMGCSPPVAVGENLVEFLSIRYWNYNFINYDEKVVDGFYDVYGITSNSMSLGKMPLLVDLQALPISDKVDYEVILVNRLVDLELQELEKRAYCTLMECQASEHDPILSGLVQKIADLVVRRLGGPVGDADEMFKKWSARSYELRNSLNTIVLPLGCLDIGLSRHRALLFKVLADKINLPCMLIKGSYYTGTDEGAVNLIKIENGSEYIIDLMGAPGALIPAEVPSGHLQNSGSDTRGFADVIETAQCSSSELDKAFGTLVISPDLESESKVCGSTSESEGIRSKVEAEIIAEKNQTERFEHEFGKLLPSLHRSHERSSAAGGKSSPAQKMKVKDVSKYVISAAKNPEFAQKLHAVLLESGASPPPDLFRDINSQDLGAQKVPRQIDLVGGERIDFHCHSDKPVSNNELSLVPSAGVWFLNNASYDYNHKKSAEKLVERHKEFETKFVCSDPALASDSTSDGYVLVGSGASETMQAGSTGVVMVSSNPSRMVASVLHEEQIYEASMPDTSDSCQMKLELVDGGKHFRENAGMLFNNIEMDKESAPRVIERNNNDMLAGFHGNQTINPLLGEVTEWDIPWEDLQIGERIGIGSYGEVYRADWNSTEVAVKKFLDQDFSGEAQAQFKYEVEIMIRLRHPNVVLFMGAVTRRPNVSIVTEFLPRGSLYRLLHRSNIQIDEKRRMRMALDVAKGMNYLHTSHPTVVHRDLKSANLLVDKNWVVKVCDFGLSRMKHHTFLSSKSTAGTPEWMAPEVLRNEPSNEKCDVYSFGVILWELATLQMPWNGLNPMQVVGAVGFQNRHLEIPEEVDSAVAQIICDCWQVEPHLRPSFSQLMYRLKRLQHLTNC